MINSFLPIASILGAVCAVSLIIAAIVFFYLFVFYLAKKFIVLIRRIK